MKIHEECATAHEQNKYRATSGVGGSKKNLNRFHLGFAWTFYMIMAVRLSNNSRASDGFFFNRNFLDLKLLLLPNIRERGVFIRKKYLHRYVLKTDHHSFLYFLFQIIRFEVLILIAFCFEKKGIIQSSLPEWEKKLSSF